MGPAGATMWGNHKNTTRAGESHNHYVRLDNTTEEFTTVGAINHGRGQTKAAGVTYVAGTCGLTSFSTVVSWES